VRSRPVRPHRHERCRWAGRSAPWRISRRPLPRSASCGRSSILFLSRCARRSNPTHVGQVLQSGRMMLRTCRLVQARQRRLLPGRAAARGRLALVAIRGPARTRFRGFDFVRPFSGRNGPYEKETLSSPRARRAQPFDNRIAPAVGLTELTGQRSLFVQLNFTPGIHFR
jgi:hypothetical protein